MNWCKLHTMDLITVQSVTSLLGLCACDNCRTVINKHRSLVQSHQLHILTILFQFHLPCYLPSFVFVCLLQVFIINNEDQERYTHMYTHTRTHTTHTLTHTHTHTHMHTHTQTHTHTHTHTYTHTQTDRQTQTCGHMI